MRKIEVKIRQIIWALKQSFKPTTYDKVIYNGNIYYIKSSLTGENIWNLFEKTKDKPTYSYIRGNELKIVHSFNRFIRVFKEHMFFQKTSWQRIDCSNPIGTRLSYISSDNIFFGRFH